MVDWLSLSTEDPLWLVKSFALVTGVASIPIILWYGLLALARRWEDRRQAKREV